MHIVTVSLNYKRTPVEWRERFAFSQEELPKAIAKLRHTKSILECVILSTCNRTEVFAVVDQLHTGRHFIKKFLSEWFEIEREQFTHYLDIKENDVAIRHLFELTVGLDSMVLGETQILGQVKDAFFLAQNEKATGTVMNTLFKQVITLAKRAHSETEIGQHAVSVSYAAVELSKKIYGDLMNKNVLILGAGKMSELTAKHLYDQGVAHVMVVNRTIERAQGLATKFNGSAHKFDELQQCLTKADILISSTGAEGVVLSKQQVNEAMQKRMAQPLFLIDIAVPRDLDPTIHDVENAFLYDIDDLQDIVQDNLKEREKEAQKIRVMIEDEMDEFKVFLDTLGVVPVINALRQKALTIQSETMKSLENKLPNLNDRERKVISKHTKSIINQMMRDPILRIKELAAQKDSKQALDMFTTIFALEEELAELEKVEQAKQLAANLQKDMKDQVQHAYKDVYGKELPVRP